MRFLLSTVPFSCGSPAPCPAALGARVMLLLPWPALGVHRGLQATRAFFTRALQLPTAASFSISSVAVASVKEIGIFWG